MKILWITNTTSLYKQEDHNHYYHGNGWVESLESLVRHQKNINLAVSFFHPLDSGKVIDGENTYYAIRKGKKNPIRAFFENITGKTENPKIFISKFIEILNDFKPDIIQVFGTERVFAYIQNYTNIPVIIHIQGIINPCLNAYYPPGFSKYNFLFNFNYLIKNLIGSSPAFYIKYFANQARRERDHFKDAKYFIGRTSWDKEVCNILAPQARYFHLDEVLRPAFYESNKKDYKKGKKIRIVSTLSSTIYKGLDVVLKTANLLSKETNISFEWSVVGLSEDDKLLRHFEKSFKIFHTFNSIKFLGVLTQIELAQLLLNSDIFVHPTYIDNSPNSVCEAQILGLPVIATNVGGIPTLINNGDTGVLVPSNGIYELAYTIKDYDSNPEKYIKMGIRARKIARKRHDKDIIMDNFLKIYQELAK